MTIATHHHLRNGDSILNQVVKEIDALGIRNITIASSSVHPVHAEIIPYIKKGVITSLECGVNGPGGEAASRGELECPIIVRSHGGRARSMMTGKVVVDVAFIGAPCCDEYGNMNGYSGPSACGSLGYSHVDARYAKTVVAVTDNLVPYPVCPVSIPQTCVDFVVQVETLGDPKKIVSTTTRVTKDPIGLMIAKYAAEVIRASGLLKNGFSFQTGAGGTSYANPFNCGAVVNRLDAVILGATEVDVDFNVNVNTESNGYLLHNTGGHTDTAAGAKLAIIVAPSIRGRLPIILDKVTTVTTPGENIDVIVTERGIAVNSKHEDLKKELIKAKMPVKDINDLRREITQITGVPRPVEFTDDIIALVEYRDGSIIDTVRRVKD